MKPTNIQHFHSRGSLILAGSWGSGTIVSLLWLLFVSVLVASAAPVMRVVKARPGTELLRNGNFEQTEQSQLAYWTAASNGFALARGEGRNGSNALKCHSTIDSGWFGASQTITLNRANALPLLVSGWSKATSVRGSPDNDYSLYVDIVYTDGTPLWGQTANFHAGSHDWEQREFVIVPEKPVKSLTINCLFRKHSGDVWFDDVRVIEVKAQNGAMVFQGVDVLAPDEHIPSNPANPEFRAPLRTADGLSLSVRDNTVASLKVSGTELGTQAPSGFIARDVGTGSDFYGFENGECTELGLKVKAHFESKRDHVLVESRLTATRGKDRAVTLVFALPIDASGWLWGDDIRQSRRIEGKGEFTKTVSIRCGATGTLSLYPLAAVWNEQAGLALAIDMAKPAQFRLGYHVGTKQLFIAYDFGLEPETEQFPSSADFRFVLYRFDPRWGFRAAFEKLTQIFPEYYIVRSRDQGLWMPFTDIQKVHGWEDFGFKYHEGNNNVTWDDAHGVLSFRYTEPMTWWMRMPKGTPRTLAEAVRLRDELTHGVKDSERQMAQVSQSATMWDESGQPSLLFRNEPWCDGAVWSLNPNPNLPSASMGTHSVVSDSSAASDKPRHNAATIHWNERLRQALYGSGAKGQLDGEYLDSLEGYVTAELNFRRDHFRYTTVPLTFSTETKQPALFKGLAVFEFTRWISEEVHRLGKLTFANGVPYRFCYLCPWLDVLGTETDWVENGKYRPPPDSQLCFWRTLSVGKPYLLLMNTDYDLFTYDMVELYFQRSLFYGMFPGMFSHNASENPYWENPKWYNRDRPLFKKYIPIIKRVAEAGWQPVTRAACDDSHILIERFGPDSIGTIFFTLFNDTDAPRKTTLRGEADALRLSTPVLARELISGQPLGSAPVWEIVLNPQQVKVIELAASKKGL